MEKLHTLDLGEIKSSARTPDLLITVAGEVPSLRNLGFKYERLQILDFGDNENQNQFIEGFAEMYPEKRLRVNILT
jgi:hypothetical protein